MNVMDLNRIVVDALAPTIMTQQWPYERGCHLIHLDDNVDELDCVATCLGLKKAWRHDAPGAPHYDLTTAKRATAIDLGIRAVTTKDADYAAYLKGRAAKMKAKA